MSDFGVSSMGCLRLPLLLLWMWAGVPGAAWGQRFSPPPLRPPPIRAPVPHFTPYPVVHPRPGPGAGTSDGNATLWLVAGGAVILVILILVVVAKKRKKVVTIRIVGTPP